MKLSCRCVIAAGAAGGLLVAATTYVIAGGSTDHRHDDDSALRYYGFVKDTSGKVVAGARVSAEVKGLGALTALTDATGAYRIPVPRVPQITPQSVRISCTKEGYKQLRTTVRSSLAKKPLVAVEVECTLQGAAGK